MPRVLLLVPSSSYRASDFIAAARALGVEVTVGSDHRATLDAFAPECCLHVDLADAPRARGAVRRFAARTPVDAVLGTDDESALLAAHAARDLGLRHSRPEAVATARDKHRFREAIRAAGLPSPQSRLVDLDALDALPADGVDYPLVVKPRALSASRGVIRADGPRALRAACERLGAILRSCASHADPAHARTALAESFIAGAEVALEGLLDAGRLRVLALFDKPDAPDGPFFAETLLVAPSRLDGRTQAAIADAVERAARAIGLREGPVHAELRVNARGPWLLELAPRTIGGLCSRALRFVGDESLETIVLRQALGLAPVQPVPQLRARGVMMLPVPRAGRFVELGRIDEACSVPGVDAVVLTVAPGELVTPLPEGGHYLGFVFASGATPAEVEQALREATARLAARIDAAGATPGPGVVPIAAGRRPSREATGASRRRGGEPCSAAR